MTEEELRAFGEKVRREMWVVSLAALATNLAILTANILWWNRWLAPVNLVGLGITAYGIRHLIELERSEARHDREAEG